MTALLDPCAESVDTRVQIGVNAKAPLRLFVSQFAFFDLLHHRQLKSQTVVPLRALDPLLHLPPLRFVEKVSTYFRTGHRKQKTENRTTELQKTEARTEIIPFAVVSLSSTCSLMLTFLSVYLFPPQRQGGRASG